MQPTRTIRAQVLTLRERAYIQVARLNGMTTFGIITRELLPNLLPYLAASFVGAVGATRPGKWPAFRVAARRVAWRLSPGALARSGIRPSSKQ
jgi:hypothetical protein